MFKYHRTETIVVKLPKLEIITFRGDYTKWQSFIDSFKAAIHSSTTLPNIDKFNHLPAMLQETP